MFRLAEVDKIFLEKADTFFMGSVKTINQEVKLMNHATRYWLGVKFFRMNEIDFQPNEKMQNKYSQVQMSRLLGIERSTIAKCVARISKNAEIIEEIKKKKFLSPIECRPKNQKAYFRSYASNFEDLGQYFK